MGKGLVQLYVPGGCAANLAHWLGSRMRFTYKLLLKKEKCNDCFRCISVCPTWRLFRRKTALP